MFDNLIQWLKEPLEWFKWMFTEAWRQVCSFVWSIWSVVLVAVGMVYSALEWVERLIAKVINAIDSLVLPSYDLSMDGAMYYMQLFNTFFPLSETLAFIVIYVTIIGLLLVYKGAKSIKSWAWAG